ncbi:ribonuclease HII [bacterium]|nr:ribonuclease HII [bacterium]
MNTLITKELELYQDYKTICGVDEAGRGPLAGPVVCSAVIFDLQELTKIANPEVDFLINNLNDSKAISEKKREKLYPYIIKYAKTYSIVQIEPETIDKLNILHATLEGMDRALEALDINWDIALIDGNKLPPRNREKAKFIIKGDANYFSIAGASVLAKVTRDRIMQELHLNFPHYNWLKNKGYPTKEHVQAINRHGLTKHHRLSYGPCSQIAIPGFDS